MKRERTGATGMASIEQLALWDEPRPLEHHLIEVHYADGRRRILDTANPDDQEAFRDMSVIYAGFVDVKREVEG